MGNRNEYMKNYMRERRARLRAGQIGQTAGQAAIASESRAAPGGPDRANGGQLLAGSSWLLLGGLVLVGIIGFMAWRKMTPEEQLRLAQEVSKALSDERNQDGK